LITLHEALEHLFTAVQPLGTERVALSQAVDRTLAEEVTAVVDLPPFDNSAMDGFAVKAEDVGTASKDNPVLLNVHHQVRAGALPLASLKMGEAVMIMTGAPLPAGATTVVMKEASEYNQDGKVKILFPAEPGDHIRPKGEDVQAGSVLLPAGKRLRPYEISLLAAQGFMDVAVIRHPRVGVLATGDELVAGGEECGPGKIYNSNGPALLSALRRWNVTGLDMGIGQDHPVALQEKIRDALAFCDVLLISGGVSVGEFDYTKAALTACGVAEVFWKVAIKPGKPLYFGRTPQNKYVFGLPGNPVSALVCLEEFVRPALEKLQGFSPRHPSYHLKGTAVNNYPLPAGRRQFLFCEASCKEGSFHLSILRPQGSAMMGMACRANSLALPDENVRRINKGDALSFRWLK
jgi:molybdopterin molybdotransferase